jgi:hypothetical protein
MTEGRQTAVVDEEERYPSRIERERLQLRLPRHKLERYWTWCEINRVDMQDAVEEAMDQFLQRAVVGLTDTPQSAHLEDRPKVERSPAVSERVDYILEELPKTRLGLQEVNRTLRRMYADLSAALRNQDDHEDRISALEGRTRRS